MRTPGGICTAPNACCPGTGMCLHRVPVNMNGRAHAATFQFILLEEPGTEYQVHSIKRS